MPLSSHPKFDMNIPQVVAHNCEVNSSGSFYIYAEPSSGELVTITQLEFGRATHRAARLVQHHSESSDGQVVAIIALSDTVLYHAVLVGLMTAKLIPFPISPRNSPAGIFELLRASSCHRIIATCTTLAPLIAAIQQHVAEVDSAFALDVGEMPLLYDVYPNLGAETAECSFQPYYTSNQSLGSSPDDIALYMHSSGSTGFPKAIAQTHRDLMGWTTLPPVAETRLYVEKPLANMALPAFHLFGITCQLLQPLFGSPAAVYPPTATSSSGLPVTSTPDNILEHARMTKCRTLTTVPALLASWFTSPEAVAYLATLHTVIWSGGPLPQRIGDGLVNAGVNLVSGYGTTETGAFSVVKLPEEDAKEWAWFQVSDLVKVRWVPQGDETFECQILASETYAPAVENLPDVRGYATSDLCVNHPQKKHLWRIVGRVDDAIVHTSGEKTIPAPMEDIVLSSPFIAGAVMFGSERPQAGILIETIPSLQIDVNDLRQVAELRNKIWPIIGEANAIAPAFSRIFKEMILFSSLDKPLPRAAKGLVLRKAALALYAEEINSIFQTVEEQTIPIDSIKPPSAWEAAILELWLLDQGFDSLAATVYRLRIIRTLRSLEEPAFVRAANSIGQNLVYSFPTIAEMSTYLEHLVAGTGTGAVNIRTQMEGLVTKYTAGLESAPIVASNVEEPAIVLLTGSTGGLGSHMLELLLKDQRVKTIYAFNRPSTAGIHAERHLDMFKERGLNPSLLDSSKLVLVEGQTSEPNLGLDAALYEEIQKSVTLIIHNAWTVDFNMVLVSFEPQIQGTRHLIDLARSSPNRPRFVFASSIAAAQGWDFNKGPCPEELLPDGTFALGAYGQSKYVAELILAKSGLDVTCLRIGQVCGALPTGAWNISQWVPILVKTSIALGCLPVASGVNIFSPPPETVAKAIIDVAFSPSHNGECLPLVLHLVHPRRVAWNFVMKCIHNALLYPKNGAKDLKFVSFADWYAALEACQFRSGDVAKDVPGLKLLHLFSRIADIVAGLSDEESRGIIYSTEKMQMISPAVRNAESIPEEQMEGWVDYWRESGFL
ncbi:Non-canonical non-ribosomal peptide synthetase FUB8 [Mycena sanguinolenta]|uniref:Non-canonical non-ribosomal peptide synthetase FUB8 n=1 Tax=Mycena sanguinolenta TaxID=230812 RepID=A0A8H7D4P1_9AGAR|nr:Non-canonical non-ribosomal peptide synthetase FUB8 [Mycena sanguinolenta]